MTDVIEYTLSLKIARANAVLAALDGHALPARLLICSGVPPSGLAVAAPGAVLIALTLTKPAGEVNAAAELILGHIQEAMVTSSGDATWAQIQTGGGVNVANITVGPVGSGASIILGNSSLDAGSLLRINSAKLIEP